MQTLFACLSILICGLGASGCAAALFAVGAGAGVATYLKGNVTRTYESDHDDLVRASTESLHALEIEITEKIHRGRKTTLSGQSADGNPVTVTIVRTAFGKGEVGVRTGPLGVADLQLSEKIQKQVAERLTPISMEVNKPPRTAAAAEKPPAAEIFAEPFPPELTIYFDIDSNALLEDEIEKLNDIAERLTRKKDLKLTLNGYSDASGPRHYNRMISESRAISVKMYLMGKGVAPSRIDVISHGAKKFVIGNSREEDRRLNRRVEIDIVQN